MHRWRPLCRPPATVRYWPEIGPCCCRSGSVQSARTQGDRSKWQTELAQPPIVSEGAACGTIGLAGIDARTIAQRQNPALSLDRRLSLPQSRRPPPGARRSACRDVPHARVSREDRRAQQNRERLAARPRCVKGRRGMRALRRRSCRPPARRLRRHRTLCGKPPGTGNADARGPAPLSAGLLSRTRFWDRPAFACGPLAGDDARLRVVLALHHLAQPCAAAGSGCRKAWRPTRPSTPSSGSGSPKARATTRLAGERGLVAGAGAQ